MSFSDSKIILFLYCVTLFVSYLSTVAFLFAIIFNKYILICLKTFSFCCGRKIAFYINKTSHISVIYLGSVQAATFRIHVQNMSFLNLYFKFVIVLLVVPKVFVIRSLTQELTSKDASMFSLEKMSYKFTSNYPFFIN